MYDLHVQSFSDAKLAWDVKSPIGEIFTASNVMRLAHMKSTFYKSGQRSGEVQSDMALLATGPIHDRSTGSRCKMKTTFISPAAS